MALTIKWVSSRYFISANLNCKFLEIPRISWSFCDSYMILLVIFKCFLNVPAKTLSAIKVISLLTFLCMFLGSFLCILCYSSSVLDPKKRLTSFFKSWKFYRLLSWKFTRVCHLILWNITKFIRIMVHCGTEVYEFYLRKI